MRNLHQFEKFETIAFLSGKKLVVKLASPLLDYTTKNHVGTKLELVIIEDSTDYQPSKDGTIQTNLYETLIVKTPHEIDIPVNTEVTLEGAVGRIWGDFRNNLTITAESVIPVDPTPKVKLTRGETNENK